MPLIQIVKTGYTKAAQRLDGVYALLCVARIAVIDIKAGISRLINLGSEDITEIFLLLANTFSNAILSTLSPRRDSIKGKDLVFDISE